MVLGIFLKERRIDFDNNCFKVEIETMEAIYAVTILVSEAPSVCFEDHISTTSILLKRDEENMVVLEFEGFAPPGEIKELRLRSARIAISIVLTERETEQINEGFRDYQQPEDFFSYFKRNLKKSENPLMMGNLEQDANLYLLRASKMNPGIVETLFREIGPEKFEESEDRDEEREALMYALDYRKVWESSPKAYNWLKSRRISD